MAFFLYGVKSIKYRSDAGEYKTIGFIEKGSFDLGGTAGNIIDIMAEQNPTAPALSIAETNGNIAPKFNIIQMDYEVLQALMGGEVGYNAEDVAVEWSAPTSLINLEGEFVIETVTGHELVIFKGRLMASLQGMLSLTETSKLAVELRPQLPDDGSAPFALRDVGAEVVP